MNAIELKAIVNYLIESYCDNVNGDFRYTFHWKSVFLDFSAAKGGVIVKFWYDYLIDGAGCAKQTTEDFFWDGKERITMLETYVNEALDRIYKAELIDNREDDPTVG